MAENKNVNLNLLPISGITLLIILCVGEPDLLDAIIAWIGRL